MAKRPSDTGRRLTLEEVQVWEAVTSNDQRLDHAQIDWESVLDTLDLRLADPLESPVIHRPTAEQFQRLLSGHAAPLPKKPVLPPVSQVDANTARRLRRGKLPVEAVLDLHGMGQEAAFLALAAFVTQSYERGRRVVQVITGKGRLSGESGGVLRRNLPLWLDRDPCFGKVLSYRPALQRDGGEGAFYLLLRRKRP